MTDELTPYQQIENEAIGYDSYEQAEELLKQLKPGSRVIFRDMPNEAYHQILGFSSSQLKRAVISERAFLNARKDKPTMAMKLGTMVHDILESKDPADVLNTVVPKSEIGFADSRTNLGRTQKKILVEGLKPVDVFAIAIDKETDKVNRGNGKIVLKDDEVAKLKQAQDKAKGRTVLADEDYSLLQSAVPIVISHEFPQEHLNYSEAFIEYSIFYRTELGQLVKCRPDLWQPNDGLIVDWKTVIDLIKPRYLSQDTDPMDLLTKACSWKIRDMQYSFSMAMYLEITPFAHTAVIAMIAKDIRELFACVLGDGLINYERRRYYQSLKTALSAGNKSLMTAKGFYSDTSMLFIDIDEERAEDTVENTSGALDEAEAMKVLYGRDPEEKASE